MKHTTDKEIKKGHVAQFLMNDVECPDCHSPLVKFFDGEQTYIQCTVEPQCTFHSLYGDGDLTK